MRRLASAAAMSAGLFVSSSLLTVSAHASDTSAQAPVSHGYAMSRHEAEPVFRIVRYGEYGRGGSALVKAHKDHAGAMRAFERDPALAAALRNRGVEIINIVGVIRTMNGSLLVFLK